MTKNEIACCTPSTQSANLSRARRPRVDIVEGPENVVVSIDLPGVTPEDIDLQVEGGTLTLEAKAPVEDEAGKLRSYLREFGPSLYRRRFRVGKEIDATGIVAEMEAGVLTLTLPKAPEAKSVQISVAKAE